MPPTARLPVVGDTVTPVTATVLDVTVAIAVFAPLTVVTVTVADPAATAVIRPVLLTDAIAVLLDDQVTFLLLAFDGLTVAVS